MQNELTLKGKIAVVTGSTAGIGLAAAIMLAGAGVAIIGVGRSQERCDKARAAILAAHPDAKVVYVLADLSKQAQVRTLAEDIKKVLKEWKSDHLDLLVNDAGTYSGKYRLTEDGAEYTLAVNHFAGFLLTHELLPMLAKAPDARILTVSSGSHYRTKLNVDRINHPLIYIGLGAYKVSKLANVLFTYEFNRQFASTQMMAFAVDPGLVNTDIALKNTDALSRFVWRIRRNSGTSPEVPAQTILHLAEMQIQMSLHDFYWKDSHPKQPSRAALDVKTAKELWNESDHVCGIKNWNLKE